MFVNILTLENLINMYFFRHSELYKRENGLKKKSKVILPPSLIIFPVWFRHVCQHLILIDDILNFVLVLNIKLYHIKVLINTNLTRPRMNIFILIK